MAVFRKQDQYRKRQTRKGLVRVSLWVPEADEATIKTLAQSMRNNYRAQHAED